MGYGKPCLPPPPPHTSSGERYDGDEQEDEGDGMASVNILLGNRIHIEPVMILQ